MAKKNKNHIKITFSDNEYSQLTAGKHSLYVCHEVLKKIKVVLNRPGNFALLDQKVDKIIDIPVCVNKKYVKEIYVTR